MKILQDLCFLGVYWEQSLSLSFYPQYMMLLFNFWRRVSLYWSDMTIPFIYNISYSASISPLNNYVKFSINSVSSKRSNHTSVIYNLRKRLKIPQENKLPKDDSYFLSDTFLGDNSKWILHRYYSKLFLLLNYEYNSFFVYTTFHEY